MFCFPGRGRGVASPSPDPSGCSLSHLADFRLFCAGLGEYGGVARLMVLIGRGREIDRLHAAFSWVRSTGRSRTVLVEAAAGCGKTEILDAFLHDVESLGLSVLRTTAIPEERETPLSVLRSLLSEAPFPDGLVRRFHEAGDSAAGRTPEAGRPGDAAWYESLRIFCGAVRDLARRAPAVVAVDDLHHGDPDSLRQLLHLARHCRNAPLLLLFTQSPVRSAVDPAFAAELLRQPSLERIRLPRLEPRDIAALLSGLGRAGAADDYRAVSGGNPLLLRALLEDDDNGTGPGDRAPGACRPGPAYGRAVLACLDRGGEKAREVAAGLAVLGAAAPGELLARLLDLPVAELAENLEALRAAGIVAGSSFQHPAARDAVLDALEPSYRTRLHLRCAELLHASGAPPALAAEHLRAAGRADGAWAVGVLQQAAEQALLADDARSALSCLELAHAGCTDPVRRTEIKIRLGAVARRTSPAEAERHVDDLLREVKAGRDAAPDTGALAALLLAHGRLEPAHRLLAGAPGHSPETGVWAAALRHVTDTWDGILDRRRWYEGTRPKWHEYPAGPRPLADRAGKRPRGRQQRTSAGLARLVADAEGRLEITRLTDDTFDLVVNAVWSLLAHGAVERARHWCDTFVRQSALCEAPGWEATFLAVRADAALHRGNLAEAERDARRALALLPRHDRSALEGSAIGRLVTIQVARGKYEDAARLLSRPTADTLPETIHWLGYRRARGLYYMATRQYRLALREFQDVARAAERWGVDWPALLPWRTDTAEALLRLGEPDQALRLAGEQLARVRDGAPRVRGISLRVKALASEPGGRLALLDGAVVELSKADDRVELARALFDLAQAHREARHAGQAAKALRKARQLAEACGAKPPYDRPPRAAGSPRAGSGLERHAEWGFLSESERRVAGLAASGYTNREISVRLYITMSTVEQHLTRVYRKLNISGRDELPTAVPADKEVCVSAGKEPCQ
ncbi:AAA family ATPase [Streptomyces leeuwenhoekii]|uniref:helix-turn-helix transcriptional regulator n=2 Tax=Streptomyces leeuwenhoekii TaxID=1437453 RepID=UPI0037CDEDD3